MSKSSDPLLTTLRPHSDNLHYRPHCWTLLTLDSKAEPRRTGGRSAQLWTALPRLAATRAITEGKASGPVSLGHTGHQAPRPSSGAPSSHLVIPCPTEGTGKWNLKRTELLEQEQVETISFNIPILQMWETWLG